jgi:acetate kinase
MAVVDVLTTGEGKVIDNVSEISAVGHRTLHGSEKYKSSMLINDTVIDDVMEFRELGPLHNPPQAIAMRACQEVFGKDMPMVAVFDTAFHQTMPAKAYMFGIPYEYYEKYSIRRYGFHGTSHRYISYTYGQMKGSNEGTRVITCHLGNGSSIAAIKDGKVVDTSMGLTPLDGFIMGTRSGGIDPSVVTYIMNKEGLTPDEMANMMNKKSGFLGLSGISSDCRDIQKAAAEGNERAKLTLDILVYQIKKFIGGYAAAMGGVDAIIFTGGIGENDATIRRQICEDMEYLGLKIDADLNDKASRRDAKFSTDDSKVEAWVLTTNEELMIARDTKEIVEKL